MIEAERKHNAVVAAKSVLVEEKKRKNQEELKAKKQTKL